MWEGSEGRQLRRRPAPLAEDGGEGAQRLIYARAIGENVQHFGINDRHIGAFAITRRGCASNCTRKVVLRAHRIALVSLAAPSSFLLHIFSVLAALPASRKSAGCAADAQRTLRQRAFGGSTIRARDIALRSESDPDPASEAREGLQKPLRLPRMLRHVSWRFDPLSPGPTRNYSPLGRLIGCRASDLVTPAVAA